MSIINLDEFRKGNKLKHLSEEQIIESLIIELYMSQKKHLDEIRTVVLYSFLSGACLASVLWFVVLTFFGG